MSQPSSSAPPSGSVPTSVSGALSGKRVLVTRTRAQASTLSALLTSHGADPVEVATIEITDAADGGRALTASAFRLSEFDWLILTSPNGATRFADALAQHDIAIPSNLRIAAIGTATAATLSAAGMKVDLVPTRHVAEGLLADFPEPTVGSRVLLPQANIARPALRDGLLAAGWEVLQVEAYQTIDANIDAADRAAAASADIVTFTSSSTVDRFCDLIGKEHLPPVVACIGPITASTAVQRGMYVDVLAEEHTVDGLVRSLVAFVGSSA